MTSGIGDQHDEIEYQSKWKSLYLTQLRAFIRLTCLKVQEILIKFAWSIIACYLLDGLKLETIDISLIFPQLGHDSWCRIS